MAVCIHRSVVGGARCCTTEQGGAGSGIRTRGAHAGGERIGQRVKFFDRLAIGSWRRAGATRGTG